MLLNVFFFLSHRRKQAEQEEELRRKERFKWVSKNVCMSLRHPD